MRIVVVGAGVLGSLYGARLAAAGQSVTLIARGGRLAELQRGPIRILNEADGVTGVETVEAVSSLEPDDAYDLALVMVRADQIDDLLLELAASRGVKAFLFMHNRAAGSSALARAVGPERLLLGFPGASGRLDNATVRYRLIQEQPTTLGEPDGRLSPRLRHVAKIFEAAGFRVALNRRMDDWLETHAMFVTAIAGAIYLADGSTSALAASRENMRTLVRGVRQGFRALTKAGVSIEPRKLALLFALPSMVPQSYWRSYLVRPAADLIFARHAQAAAGEMLKLVEELRLTVRLAPGSAPELEALWAAVVTAAGKRPQT
jgi:2-dehydropantoate 2-reductase